MADGTKREFTDSEEVQLEEWYAYRNYDRRTGKPKPEELERVGLAKLLANDVSLKN